MALPAQCGSAKIAETTQFGALPGMNGESQAVRRDRFPSPVVPVVLAVTLSLASIAALVLLAALALDRQAAKGARNTVETNLQVEAERLWRMVADTAWSDPAYRHLVVEANRSWADGNIGSYLKTSSGVDFSLAMDASGKPTLAFVDGRPVDSSQDGWSLPPGLDHLAQQARSSVGSTPIPVTGYLVLDDQPYLVAVTAFGSEDSGRYVNHGAVLAFGRRLDRQRVTDLGRLYRIRDLTLVAPDKGVAGQYVELRGPDRVPVAALAWPKTRDAQALLTRLLPPLAAVVLLVVFLVWRFFSVETAQRRRNEAELHRLATTDALSGVGNRCFFMDMARVAVAKALGAGYPLTLVSMDIDHLKRVNDTYGHGAGDAVIRTVAQTLLAQLRETDLVARLGGEEFAALLPETDAGQAHQVVERVRRTLAQWPVDYGEERISATVSIGVAELKADRDLESLLYRADEALYRAQEAGRNRTVRSA